MCLCTCFSEKTLGALIGVCVVKRTNTVIIYKNDVILLYIMQITDDKLNMAIL